MKKPYSNPEWHLVSISSDKTNAEIAAMSDDDFEKKLKKSGFYENRRLYKAAEGYLARSVAGETVIVPVGERSKDLNGYATFTETGQFLWSLLSTGERTIADLTHELAIECKVSPEDIQDDVDTYVKKMIENGFIVQCN